MKRRKLCTVTKYLLTFCGEQLINVYIYSSSCVLLFKVCPPSVHSLPAIALNSARHPSKVCTQQKETLPPALPREGAIAYGLIAIHSPPYREGQGEGLLQLCVERFFFSGFSAISLQVSHIFRIFVEHLRCTTNKGGTRQSGRLQKGRMVLADSHI